MFFKVTGLEVTGERFGEVLALDVNEELKGSMGLFKGSEKHEIVIEFDAWGRMMCAGGWEPTVQDDVE